MTIPDGTFDGYDCIISVTQEAINKQLVSLYETPIKTAIKEPLPDPPSADADGDTALILHNTQPAHFLINHELELHPVAADGTVVTTKGIFGHIECPQVSFLDSKTVRISIKFRKDDGLADVTKQPSKFKWTIVDQLTDKVTPIEKEITGYTFSFEANVDRKDIQDLAKELINPSQSQQSTVSLADSAHKQLNTVTSEEFLVSTFFCLFNSAQIVDPGKFRMTDAAGVAVETKAWLAFISIIGEYYGRLGKHFNDKTKETTGLPTPNNPFIFGYGIKQKPKDAAETAPQLNKDNVPLPLLPKGYRLIASPTKSDHGGSLQYGMMTYRDSGQPSNGLTDSDARDAAQPSDGYFDTIRASRGDYSGIAGFSNDCFFQFYLLPQLRTLFEFSPTSERFKFAKEQFSAGEPADHSTSEIRTKFYYDNKHSWSTKEVAGPGNNEYLRLPCTSHFTINMSADNRDQNFAAKPDSVRKVHVNVNIRDRLMYYDDFEHRAGLFDSTPERSMWVYVEAWRRFDISFTISITEHGVFDVTTSGPQGIGEPYMWEKNPGQIFGGGVVGPPAPPMSTDEFGNASPTGLGLFVRVEANKLGFNAAQQMSYGIGNLFRYSLDKEVREMCGNLAKFLTGTRTRIVMPASEAFSFTGANLDDKGNLLSAIKYDDIKGGEVIKPSA